MSTSYYNALKIMYKNLYDNGLIPLETLTYKLKKLFEMENQQTFLELQATKKRKEDR